MTKKKIDKKVKDLTVVYDNELNLIQTPDFDIYELNLFYGILAMFKKNPNSPLILNYESINMLAGRTFSRTSRDKQFVDKFFKHISSTVFKLTEDKKVIAFPLVSKSIHDLKTGVLILNLNKEEGIPGYLDDLTKNFTKFNFSTYYHLESKYSKALFRLLSQYKNTGIYHVDLEDFKFLMGMSSSITNGDLINKVLKPAINELLTSKELVNLTFNKKKNGATLTGFEFKFRFKSIKKDVTPKKKLPSNSKKEEFTDEEMKVALAEQWNWGEDDE